MTIATLGAPGPGTLMTAVQGLKRASAQAGEAAGRIAGGEIEPRTVVAPKTAETAFKANAAVIRTADEMQHRLLDVLA